MDPLEGTISFGLIALLSLTSGVLAFVFAKGFGAVLHKITMTKHQPMSPLTLARVIAGFWVLVGLLAAAGALYQASRLPGS